MSSIYKMARRNLWRNKRRTIITVASIFVTVFLALVMRSMQDAVYAGMIDNSVKLTSGHIQVQNKKYPDEKSVNNSVEDTPEMRNILSGTPGISMILPRIESFALASSGNHTKGVAVNGIDPVKEDSLLKLSDKITTGKYLTPGSRSVLIGEKLAAFLNIGAGDTMILIGQGFRGVSASGKFVVSGTFTYPSNEVEGQLIFIPVQAAAEFFDLGNRITSYKILLNSYEMVPEAEKYIEKRTDQRYAVLPWQELNKELLQAIAGDDAQGIITLGILYVIAGFGILGTMIMMTMERKKEFAIMMSLGMQKNYLFRILGLETLLIGIAGTISGSIASYPLLLYLENNPIQVTGDLAKTYIEFGMPPVIPFSTNPEIFISQAIVTLLIAIAAVVYPVLIAGRINPAETMRG